MFYANAILKVFQTKVQEYDKNVNVGFSPMPTLNEGITVLNLYVNLPTYRAMVACSYSDAGLVSMETHVEKSSYDRFGTVLRTLQEAREYVAQQARELALLTECEKRTKELPFVSNTAVRDALIEKYTDGNFTQKTVVQLAKEDTNLLPFKFEVTSKKPKRSYIMSKPYSSQPVIYFKVTEKL